MIGRKKLSKEQRVLVKTSDGKEIWFHPDMYNVARKFETMPRTKKLRARLLKNMPMTREQHNLYNRVDEELDFLHDISTNIVQDAVDFDCNDARGFSFFFDEDDTIKCSIELNEDQGLDYLDAFIDNNNQRLPPPPPPHEKARLEPYVVAQCKEFFKQQLKDGLPDLSGGYNDKAGFNVEFEVPAEKFYGQFGVEDKKDDDDDDDVVEL